MDNIDRVDSYVAGNISGFEGTVWRLDAVVNALVNVIYHEDNMSFCQELCKLFFQAAHFSV